MPLNPYAMGGQSSGLWDQSKGQDPLSAQQKYSEEGDIARKEWEAERAEILAKLRAGDSQEKWIAAQLNAVGDKTMFMNSYRRFMAELREKRARNTPNL